jgi:hypothetical protein
MYHESGIQKLSSSQLSKLLNGKSVRVKSGTAHKVGLSTEQHKKLMRAHAKGKAATITFDPYQIQSHQTLRGKCSMVVMPPHTIMHGGTTAKDWLMNQYNEHIPEAYHPGLESIGRAGLAQAGLGLKKKRGRPRKIQGGDIFEDVCVIPEGNEDAVYFIVKRTINGVSKRYIERMSSPAFNGSVIAAKLPGVDLASAPLRSCVTSLSALPVATAYLNTCPHICLTR